MTTRIGTRIAAACFTVAMLIGGISITSADGGNAERLSGFDRVWLLPEAGEYLVRATVDDCLVRFDLNQHEEGESADWSDWRAVNDSALSLWIAYAEDQTRGWVGGQWPGYRSSYVLELGAPALLIAYTKLDYWEFDPISGRNSDKEGYETRGECKRGATVSLLSPIASTSEPSDTD